MSALSLYRVPLAGGGDTVVQLSEDDAKRYGKKAVPVKANKAKAPSNKASAASAASSAAESASSAASSAKSASAAAEAAE